MEDATKENSTPRVGTESNLQTALRHDRFTTRCTRYLEWVNDIQETMEKLYPLNKTIVLLVKEAMRDPAERTKRSEDAIMRTAISLAAYYQC